MLRKHINFMDYAALDNLPFYCWKCITLQTAKRDIDLVIEDDLQMFIFIKFLIYIMQTIDGKKNTAKPYLEYVNNKQFDRIKRVTGTAVSKTEMFRLKLKSEEILFSNIVKKYFIVKIRLKVSFMAMKRAMTVNELFYTTIVKIHREQTQNVKFDHPLELGFVYKLLNLRV